MCVCVCVFFEGNQEAPAEPVLREAGENSASNCQPDGDTKGKGPAAVLTRNLYFVLRAFNGVWKDA